MGEQFLLKGRGSPGSCFRSGTASLPPAAERPLAPKVVSWAELGTAMNRPGLPHKLTGSATALVCPRLRACGLSVLALVCVCYVLLSQSRQNRALPAPRGAGSFLPHTGHSSAADTGALGPELHREKAPRRADVCGREAQLRRPQAGGRAPR